VVRPWIFRFHPQRSQSVWIEKDRFMLRFDGMPFGAWLGLQSVIAVDAPAEGFVVRSPLIGVVIPYRAFSSAADQLEFLEQLLASLTPEAQARSPSVEGFLPILPA
jgi:hypothetical protein